MPIIEWDPSFSVGNEELDRQHKEWIEITNKLHSTLLHGDMIELNQITLETLKAMRDYTRNHFSFEEEYMEKIGYPDIEEHKQKHSKFYVMVMDCYNDFQAGKTVLNSQIMSTLKEWLQNHIINEDKKFADFAAKQKI